jgi:acyl transferase domain-containing protein
MKAGVSSFGWGGTNVHLVLEEYCLNVNSMPRETYSRKIFMLPVSARSPKALVSYLKSYKDFIVGKHDEQWLMNVCKNAALLKPHFEYRALITGENAEELKASISEAITNELFEATKIQAGDKIVFVFPGQGSQWLGMGKQLYTTDKTFKEAIDSCDKAFKPYVDWSLTAEMFADEQSSQLKKINVIQPAICAIQIALGKLWLSWGIIPDAIVGHSMGEVAAAHIAGILTLDDAARIICSRSALMSTLSAGGGAMALTELGSAQAQEMVDKYQGKICIAVQNSPKSTVFAGDKATIDQLLAELEKNNLFCRLVKVDVASHSPQMDPIKEELRAALQTLHPLKSKYAFYSTVKAAQMDGPEMGADYWVNNLRNMVQFSSVIQELSQTGHNIYVEVSPHPVL